MKDTLIQQCLDLLKREDIKYQMRSMFAPIMEVILMELNPYIYTIITLVFIIFLMILAILIIFILILRNKNIFEKLF
jgi:heme/copper-type cytochrome/quinol oxidase subunit 2